MSEAIIRATRTLRRATEGAEFSPPVAAVYHPLSYAWEAHKEYLHRYAGGTKRAIFIGMNPGPWGMAQTGIPFGDVESVRDYLGITAPVGTPSVIHPKRPVLGLNCPRREVSGARLWGFFQQQYGDSAAFFKECYVSNYCPLLFLRDSGANLTPVQLPAAETAALYAHCDKFLRTLVQQMQPEMLIGVGDFAETRLRALFGGKSGLRIGKILHPSPASPAANKGFAEKAAAQLASLLLPP